MSASISFSGKLADPMVTDVEPADGVVAAVAVVGAELEPVVVGVEVFDELPQAARPRMVSRLSVAGTIRRMMWILCSWGLGIGGWLVGLGGADPLADSRRDEKALPEEE